MQAKRSAAKTTLALLIGAAIVAALILRLRANAETEARPKQPDASARVVPVLTAAVEQRDIPIALEGLGSAASLHTVTVRSQVDGRLNQVFFKEGQFVHKGELLAQIDPRPYTIQLHQAEANLARDRANLESGRANLDRLNKLSAPRFVSAQDLQNQVALVGGYEGSVQFDQAQIESAKLNLDYARIVSPLDGVAGIRLVDPGNYVRASDATGIVIVTQLDPIGVIFTLPQDDLPKVAEQLGRGVDLPVDAYDRSGANKLASGLLRVIDNQVVASTATIRLKAYFPNPDRHLWPNLFVKARLHLAERKGALVVPATAVQRGPRGTFVYVVRSDQTVEARPIELEQTVVEQAIVHKGLTLGEQVVVEGQNMLRPGARVRPQSARGRAEPQQGALP